MKDNPSVIESLDRALMDITNAKQLLTNSLKNLDDSEQRDALQQTYDKVDNALEAVREADYKYKK